jgi:hypothetical protein
METINKDDLYPVLQNSNLADQFDDKVIVPKKYLLNEDETITKLNVNKKTFHSIMEKLRYFMVKELPYEIYDYVKEDFDVNLEDFKDFHYEELVLLRDDYCEIMSRCEELEDYHIYNNFEYVSVHDLKDNLLIKCLEHEYYDLMKYLKHAGFSFDSELFVIAIQNVNLKGIKFLHENECKIDSYLAYIDAAQTGNIECLKYVHSICPFSNGGLEAAVSGNNWDCVNYVLDNLDGEHMIKELNYLCTCRAAQNGNLEMLKFLHNKGAPLHDFCASWAASCGTSIFNDKPDKDKFNDYLDCIKYLHKNNCPWSSDTCENAIVSSNFDILKYAIENGCLYDKSECLVEANKVGNVDMINYIKSLN